MIVFKGVLGNNCGSTTDINLLDKRSAEYKRFKAKGYSVSGGIETLRGFAKIGDLAKASTIDKGYQRSKDQEHIKDISIFLDEGRALSKFLPEVILVGNKDSVNLSPFSPSGKVSQKVATEISGLENYTIEIAEKSLKRIDGNHRLEAGANKNLIIPFAIILWPESENAFQENRDNEAFLFHFLNGKAKKLTPEENYKGLANSSTWSTDELKQVNPIIPYLQQFLQIIIKNNDFDKDLFSEGPLSQIAEVLEHLSDNTISPVRFKKIIDSTLAVLHEFEKFPYLKSEFNHLLPQLAFINFYSEKPIEHLVTISNWLKKFRYEKGAFKTAKSLYEIADKQLRVVHLKVFVAMPFWKDRNGRGDVKEVIRYNNVYEQALKEVLGSNNPHIHLELIPIMLRKGKAIRIDSQILKEIEEADIFIGDITENNHNVVFEIGYAAALNKPSIILRKSSFTEPPPFDIDKILYKQYEYDDANFEKSLTTILKVNIPVILKEDFDLVLNSTAKKKAKDQPANKKESGIDTLKEEVLTDEEIRLQKTEDYEEMYISEVEKAVSHAMNKAEWDFDNHIIEFGEDGKVKKIDSMEKLESHLVEIAKKGGYPNTPKEGEERDIMFHNIDWDISVQRVLKRYNDQLSEIGWI